MKRKILSNYNNYFQEKKCDNIIKYMGISTLINPKLRVFSEEIE